jgi:hypothetical protein
MAFEDLLYDSSRICIEMAADVIDEDPNIFHEAFELIFQNKYKISARASRVIYFFAARNPEMIKPYLSRIIAALPVIDNNSILQNLLKILTEHPLPDDEEILGLLLNKCFEFIDSVETKPAVKVYSLDILYNLSLIFPDIREELFQTIEKQIPQSSAGFKTRGEKMLEKLSG